MTRQYSSKRTGEKRTNQDLIKNRFELKVEFKIERKDDIDTISNKIFDFSSNTISRLIKEGIKDALDYLVNKDKKDYLVNKDKKDKKCSLIDAIEHLDKFIKDIKNIGEPTLVEEIHMIKLACEHLDKSIKDIKNIGEPTLVEEIRKIKLAEDTIKNCINLRQYSPFVVTE